MDFLTGIDEAGRGALIGPMVIAGVTIPVEHEKNLRNIGVKDSKVLSPRKREELAGKIEKLATNIVVLRVQACKIDDYRSKGINLDKIEAMKMSQIIDACDGSKIFVDSLEQNSKRYKKMIEGFLQNKNADLVVENYLDESIPVVSAASIIAKVERDRAIAEIKKQVNFDFGVGYSHDARTIEFVENLIKQRKSLPSFVRKSWVTTQFLQEKNWQRKIKDFFLKEEECREE